MIQVADLTKVYGEQTAINRLNFSIGKGEIVGFLGPNGAGKSTTMKIMTCYLPPTSGTVEIGDFNIVDHPLEIRKQIGYLPEHNPLYLDMYVHEFLTFAANIHGIKGKEAKQRVADVIERTGLGREQHKKIGMLSKGYRQRVGLSQAMIHDPQVLILDEPTTGLDPNQIVDIRNLIREIGQEKTVIFSSHILSEVESIAKRVIIINRGDIIADEPTDNLRLLAEDQAEVRFEVKEAGFSTETISQAEGVREVEQIGDREFLVRSAPEVDIRPLVFEACVAQSHILLGMNLQKLTLEDAFRKLTQ
ncbi:gliding motility-associated ABC transporter ATP-binding subunit GldA [Pontibacter sp. G13]|uniref:gliding motility-associated ABC transporter ATP-binding subunit GldA n=1 Tax=Pontibacter sp. G13 TaxID=3074898 RepID=UPI00288C60CD|nr:gliding motility-associated ABC transporter ATP-binding subunit GldA [Pontibacter sp. G13]WNJ21279.1 gliding motility-associated ABC transporter ATP-binding subunit GldA [Pontibacter sp. G13]